MKKKIRRVPNSNIGGVNGGIGFVNNRRYSPPKGGNSNLRISRL